MISDLCPSCGRQNFQVSQNKLESGFREETQGETVLVAAPVKPRETRFKLCQVC